MSRQQQRIKRAAKRKQKTAERLAIAERINAVVRPMGCYFIALGPSAVGVQGDARTYGFSVVIGFPTDATGDHINEVSTLITNRVSNVTRVLQHIPI
jgi:GMP synthase PP-ATPase subunit